MAEFDAALDGVASPGALAPEDVAIVREFATRLKAAYTEALEQARAEEIAQRVTPAAVKEMIESVILREVA
jgi:hypothetical protein